MCEAGCLPWTLSLFSYPVLGCVELIREALKLHLTRPLIELLKALSRLRWPANGRRRLLRIDPYLLARVPRHAISG